MTPVEPLIESNRTHDIFADFHKVECAIRLLLSNDNYLLRKSCSERSITHKLAQYLEYHYNGLDVDCEYNLNISGSRGKKSIQFLEHRFHELSIPRRGRAIQNEFGDDLIEICVSPDVIIHKRGTNSKNTAIIEVKKQGGRDEEYQFDREKLAFYTDQKCDFRYPIGYLINLPHGKELSKAVEVILYSNGVQIESISLPNDQVGNTLAAQASEST